MASQQHDALTKPRISDADRELLAKTFAGNDDLYRLIRKLFLPTISEDDPIAQSFDMWTLMPLDPNAPAEEYKIQVLARNNLVAHIEGRLRDIYLLSNGVDKMSPEEQKAYMARNSSK